MSASAGWRFATATHRSTQSCAPSRRSVRAVVSAGWGGLAHGDLPPSVFALDEVPHDRLFPGLCCKDDRRRWEDGDKLDPISFMRRCRKER
jgi:hypothetical protein